VTAIARMAVLNLRTVAPNRAQGLLLFGGMVLIGARSPIYMLPALALLFSPQIAGYPFNVAERAGLETLYAVLPVPRRSVLLGYYTWAVASFLATAAMGTALALFLARAQAIPFGGRTLVTMLTLSWALFALNVAIQFPLLTRFGYTRAGVLGTTLPLALVGVALVRLHLHVSFEPLQVWLPLLGLAGVAVMAGSVAVAISIDQRRVRYGGPERDDRSGRNQHQKQRLLAASTRARPDL
jgi:hypothetical protein